MNLIFPFNQYWHVYLGFVTFLLLVVVFDLGIFHRKAHRVSMKEASLWTIGWIGLALAFNYWLYCFTYHTFTASPELLAWSGKTAPEVSKQIALEYLTGYVVEKSLAIDNIFVFVVIFNYFAVPARFQHRILFFGIIGAIIFRGVFIGLGSLLLQYHWILLVFGAFLIFTGFKLCFASEKEESGLDGNFVLKILRRVFPIGAQGTSLHFFTRENGKVLATPFLIALLMIEASDIIFAVDSVPAIFAITKEPLVVFTSNMMALLGLRSLYFLLAGSVDVFYLLRYGLGIVLVFVGLKMVWLNDLFGGKFPISYSLGFITGVILLSMAGSVLFPKQQIDDTTTK